MFLRSVRQARPTAKLMERDLIGAVMATSDPTLRAVFAEDSAALIGLAIAAVGLGAHQLTGSATPDAIESILVGVLLAAVATVLIDRNREFLIGEEAPRIRAAALRALLAEPGVARVTCLRLEFVGPRLVSIIGDVDLTGDDAESRTSPSGSARWKRRWTPLQRWPALCSACLRRTSLRLLNKPPRRESLAPQQPQLMRARDGLEARVRPEPEQDVTDVIPHRLLAQVEHGGDVLRRCALPSNCRTWF